MRWSIHDRRVRSLGIQALTILFLVLAVFGLASNVAHNLEVRGISSGFGFLDDAAGFDISMHLVEYDESSPYSRALLVAILNTLLVSLLGIFIATIMGVLLGIARLSSNFLVARLSAAYVEMMRNIPLLLHIFFWYFAVFQKLPHPRQSLTWGDSVFLNVRGLFIPSPQWLESWPYWLAAMVVSTVLVLIYRQQRNKHFNDDEVRSPPWYFALLLGFLVVTLLLAAVGSPLRWQYPELQGFNFSGGIQVIPEFSALLIALSTYTAAFIAEIVRSGILSVSKGQKEAAYSLGLSRMQSLRLIILPQATRVIIPPLSSQYLNLAKNSSLASAIAFPDLVLVFSGTSLNQTGQAIETVAITMAFYLVLSLGISAFMNWYNHKQALKGASI